MLPGAFQDEFISQLAETGNVSLACKSLGISRMTPYGWRDTRPGFAERWDAAIEVSRDHLRQRVLETALIMGLAKYIPLVDPDTGDAILNDDFEPVMVLDTSHVDTRVLTKLMDKVRRDEVRQVEQRSHVIYEGPAQIRVYSPDGELIEGDYEVVTDDE